MQSARRAASQREVSQLLSTHTPIAHRAAAAFPLVGLAFGTANSPGAEWQSQVDLSILQQLLAIDSFNCLRPVFSLLLTSHTHIALRQRPPSEQSKVHITVDDRSEDDASHRSETLYK